MKRSLNIGDSSDGQPYDDYIFNQQDDTSCFNDWMKTLLSEPIGELDGTQGLADGIADDGNTRATDLRGGSMELVSPTLTSTSQSTPQPTNASDTDADIDTQQQHLQQVHQHRLNTNKDHQTVENRAFSSSNNRIGERNQELDAGVIVDSNSDDTSNNTRNGALYANLDAVLESQGLPRRPSGVLRPHGTSQAQAQAKERYKSDGFIDETLRRIGRDILVADEAKEIDPQSIDATTLVTRELNELTLRERERIYADINGVSEVTEETPELLKSTLENLQVELILIAKKPAYEMAQQDSLMYVEDRSLRLRFLRSVDFDAAKAAKKFVGWFDFKLELFGREKLCSQITLDNLSPDAQATLKSGRMQMLPRRDVAGRAVLCDMLREHARVFKSTISMMQAGFYFCTAILDDEETQKSGLICLHYARNWVFDLSKEQRECFWKMCQMTVCMPVKLQAFHFIAERESLLIKQFINLIRLGVAKEVRHRFLTHFGSQMECHYSLMGYGVPISLVPVTDKGGLRTSNHLKWMEYRQRKESVLSMQLNMMAEMPMMSMMAAHHGGAQPLQQQQQQSELKDQALQASNSIDRGTAQATTKVNSSTPTDMTLELAQVHAHQCNTISSNTSPSFTSGDVEADSDIYRTQRAKVDHRSEIAHASTQNTQAARSPGAEPAESPGAPSSADSKACCDKELLPELIDLPSRYDVLLGRGRPFQEHSGNKYLKDLIVEWYGQYDVATKIEKTAMAEHLVNLIKRKGGNFLKKNKDGFWVKAAFIESRTKVSHGFRKKREMDSHSKVGRSAEARKPHLHGDKRRCVGV